MWQRSVSGATLRRAAGAGASLAATVLLCVGTLAWALPHALESARVRTENAALREEVEAVRARVEEMDAMVARVASLDERLRGVAREGALPGAGPVDAEEAEAFQAWMGGAPVVPSLELPSEPRARVAALGERTEALSRSLAALDLALPELEEAIVRVDGGASALPDRWPLDGVLTSPYGWRRNPFGGAWTFHTGIDIGVPTGTPVLATADGVVVRSGVDSGRGLSVVIDHGSEVLTRYGHCSELLLEAGDEVEAGDVIALSGSTGRSTGPHLHYDLFIDGESVDPLAYLP